MGEENTGECQNYYMHQSYNVDINIQCMIYTCVFQKSSDTHVLLNLNQMKAAKRLIFGIAKQLFQVSKVTYPLQGFGVHLPSVVELIIRDQRLHQVDRSVVSLNIKD